MVLAKPGQLLCGLLAAGWLGLQQLQGSPAKATAAEAEAREPAQMEHSQGLLEVLSALGGTSASPAAPKEGRGALALPLHIWKEQGKLVQQLVLVLLQILTMHHEVGVAVAPAWECCAVYGFKNWLAVMLLFLSAP